ncbi:MAG: serine hydrolase, partial [Bacteroidales bacterium]|nr:serine hydrolase [Bacteroidales bacterium]
PAIKRKSSPCAPEASQKSFGHSGFTGTFVWVDPEYNLTYIFLSNRAYPDVSTNKLAKMNIRTNIQSEIYKAITNKK